MVTEKFNSTKKSEIVKNNLLEKKKNNSEKPENNPEESEQTKIIPIKKDQSITIKAIRKILRKIDKIPTKDQLNLMVWEVDDNLDGKISRFEIEKMYKRCLWDKEELEPKRLHNLFLFLMYDKENRNYITEEDTLELLIIRYGEKFNDALNEIFVYFNNFFYFLVK